jgi:uncharacterized protein YbbC (DUF1343 family)
MGLCVAGALVLLAAAPVVEVGLERIERDRGAPLKGKRVGLVAHAASVTADGRHAIDVLRALGIDLRRVFAPEHGLESRAAAGESVAGGALPATGVPVVSLYGAKTKPDADDLRGLDVLVVDLQDAGVRFYTYASTLLLCLEAAAEAGLELVVLDRPNPLGGVLMEGPSADPGRVAPSLVSRAPGPLVHGLTFGELARFVNGRRARPVRLTVVAMTGWRRPMVWTDTGRPWVAPSPNLRSPEAALVYPGVCLLEATNLTEGRGTEAPFLLFGAPWMRAEAVAAAVSAPGLTLEPKRFTPVVSEAAPDPKFSGQECAGLGVRVTDPHAVRPYAFGLDLVQALRRLHPEFRWNRPGALDWLLGTPEVREALERGDSTDAVRERDRKTVAAFARERQSSLLY